MTERCMCVCVSIYKIIILYVQLMPRQTTEGEYSIKENIGQVFLALNEIHSTI